MWRGIVTLIAVAILSVPAASEGVPRQSKIWTPQSLPTALETSTGYVYMGVLGGYASLEDNLKDGIWRAGLNLGYLAKMKNMGLGLEVEALRHFDDELEQPNELNNWEFSARGRLGLFVSNTFMPYVTAGYTWLPNIDEGSIVYGLGTELFTNERMSIRVEALKYVEEEDLLDIRTGISFRF